jgi:Tfp pilus assembly protein PilO
MRVLASLIPRGRTAWTLLGGGLLTGGVMIGVLAGPVRSALALVDESVARQEERLARNLSMVASKEEVARAYASVGRAIAKQGSTSECRNTMLAEIEKEASDAGVVLSATKPREPRCEKDFEEHEVGIEIEGSMKALVRFLYGIESSPQLLRVERLVLDAKTDGEAGVLRGNLTVTKVVTL